MIPEFRDAILNIVCENKAEDMVYQLQKLFATLQESNEMLASPASFISTIRNADGQPIDPRVQQDSSEFFRNVLERIDMYVRGTKNSNVVSGSMGFSTVTQKIGRSGCLHVSEREQNLNGALEILVKHNNSLEQGLRHFTKGEQMSGVICDGCKTKVSVELRNCLKLLPPTLVFVLKRFDFNFETGKNQRFIRFRL
jgi:uncharacterized UBP type Zn finger protein